MADETYTVPTITPQSNNKRKHEEIEATPADQMSSIEVPSSTVDAASTSDPAAPLHSNLSESDRAAKRAKREERIKAIQEMEEKIEPLYPGYPECRVLIYNVAKKQNVGTIVRTAVAFAATQIIVVGNRKLNTLGNQATNRFISWRHFEKWPDCLKWIRSAGFKLIGVEIGARAKNISTRPFSDKTIFILGNEGQGLSQEVMDACDELVYIPQYGRGTASLNVATAASVVLHHFAEWAQYPSHAPIAGFKFEVDESKARIDQGLKLKQIEEAAAASSSSAVPMDENDGGDAADDAGD